VLPVDDVYGHPSTLEKHQVHMPKVQKQKSLKCPHLMQVLL